MIHYLSSAKPPAASLLERHEAGRLLRVGEWVEAGGGLVLTPGPWHRSREPQVNIEVEVLVCGGRVAGVEVLGVDGGVGVGVHGVRGGDLLARVLVPEMLVVSRVRERSRSVGRVGRWLVRVGVGVVVGVLGQILVVVLGSVLRAPSVLGGREGGEGGEGLV